MISISKQKRFLLLVCSALLMQCHESDALLNLYIEIPPGCLGNRIEKFNLKYNLSNVQGVLLNEAKQDAIDALAPEAASCSYVEPRGLMCLRRLRFSSENKMQELTIQVEAFDQDSHELVLQGESRNPLLGGTQENEVTVELTPTVSAQGGLFRVRTVSSGTSQTLRAVWSDAPGNAWAAGELGTLVRWVDGQLQQPPALTAPDLHALWGASADDVWVGGRMGAVHRLRAEGWQAATPLGGQTIYGLAGSAAAVWAVGSAGAIFRFDGQRWAADTSLMRMASLDPSEDVTAISVDGAGNALAVGIPGGFTLAYSAAAGTWTRLGYNLGTNLYDVWMLDSATRWAVGGNGSAGAFRWGGSWSGNLCSAPGRVLRGVWGKSADLVWATGEDGALYRLTSAGCELVSTGSQDALYKIWGTSDDLWAVGANGKAVHACIGQ